MTNKFIQFHKEILILRCFFFQEIKKRNDENDLVAVITGACFFFLSTLHLPSNTIFDRSMSDEQLLPSGTFQMDRLCLILTFSFEINAVQRQAYI